MNMTQLPRGLNNLIIKTIYHPPGAAMLDYLSCCLSTLESHYPNCGLILLGDFNKLPVSKLNYNYNLCQLLRFLRSAGKICALWTLRPCEYCIKTKTTK